MSYRDDLAALEARVESLHREANEKVEELDRAQQLVAEARRRVRTRVLDAELATPCAANWDDMKGNDRVRHCGQCKKNVYNFAALTREQIERLVHLNEGKLCVRFFVRADGTMVTKDCKLDIHVRKRKLVAELGAAAVAAGALAAAGGAFVDGHRAAVPTNVSEAMLGATSFELETPPPEYTYDDAEPARGATGGEVTFSSSDANPSDAVDALRDGVTFRKWQPATSQEVQDGASFNKREAKRQKAASSGPSFNGSDELDPK
ncbi:MAG TPA: hypothetical protein VIV11_15825 [Kofleriaceae bacterium]